MNRLFSKLANAARWVVEAFKSVNARLAKTKIVLYVARYFIKGRHRPVKGEAQYVQAGKALLVRSASAVSRRTNPVANYLRAHRTRRAVAQEPALVAVGHATVNYCEAPVKDEEVFTDPLVEWVAKMMEHNQYYDDIMRGRTTDLMGPIRKRVMT